MGARLGCGHYSSKRCVNFPRSEVDTSFLCFRKDSISEGVKRGLAGFDSSGTAGVASVVGFVDGSFCVGIITSTWSSQISVLGTPPQSVDASCSQGATISPAGELEFGHGPGVPGPRTA